MSSQATSRENHFLPQFYLRYFSKDGRRTNLFNFSRNRLISGVSIKHQCSRHNFYAFVPTIEEEFSRLEGGTAEVLRNVKTVGDVPRQGSQDWSMLLGYVVFQKLRTANAGRMNDVLTDYMAKLLIEGNPEFAKIDPDSFQIQNTYPVAIPLSLAGEMIPIAEDLRMHLLINETSREFITSDGPVVIHNQYCEGIDYRGVLGWNCTGLQVYWPISPHHLLFLFDPAVYKVGRSHRGVSTTKIASEHDVDQLNLLQVLNAQHNVYFADLTEDSKMERRCRTNSTRRPKSRSVIVETEGLEKADEKSGSILHSYEPLLPLRLSVNAIAVRRKYQRISLHHRAAMYRKAVEWTDDERAAYGNPKPGRYPVKKVTRK